MKTTFQLVKKNKAIGCSNEYDSQESGKITAAAFTGSFSANSRTLSEDKTHPHFRTNPSTYHHWHYLNQRYGLSMVMEVEVSAMEKSSSD